jgi:hypothetical protein
MLSHFSPEATPLSHVIHLTECGIVLESPFIQSNKLHNRKESSSFNGWLDNLLIEKGPSLGTNSHRVTDGHNSIVKITAVPKTVVTFPLLCHRG